MKIQNFLMWFKNGLKAHKLLAQCVKRVGIKKALQEVACCCSLAGDFYHVIGLTCEVFLPNLLLLGYNVVACCIIVFPNFCFCSEVNWSQD